MPTFFLKRALVVRFLFSIIALVVPHHVVDSFSPLQQQQQQQHDRATMSMTTTSSKKEDTCRRMLFASTRKQQQQQQGDDSIGNLLSASSSYSNPWLYFFHNQAQQEMQLTTNSLAVWNEAQQREQEQIREWQDSFHRNGLSDFCPPMSANLKCLMIGHDNLQSSSSSSSSSSGSTVPVVRLPWEDEPQADITSLQVVVQNDDDTTSALLVVDQEDDDDDDDDAAAAALMVRTTLVSSSSQQQPQSSVPMFTSNNKEKKAAVYDCIVDHGLLQAVVKVQDDDSPHQSQSQEEAASAVSELLFEAATALKEHGIYILITPTLSTKTRQLLEQVSVQAGLEWAFELDGISGAEQQQVVSVARRFNTGYMPKAGKLVSRFQP